MEEDFKKIKSEILKSGLPLESMVSRVIDSASSKLTHPLINIGEFFYERQGKDLPFSIDFNVLHDLDIENCDFMEIVFLIECKYCTRGTKWFFIPNPVKDAGMEFFIENFFDNEKCNLKKFPSTSYPLLDRSIPILGKGTEIYSNGQRNEKTIHEALHQFMFASASQLSRAFMLEDDVAIYMLKRGIDVKRRSFHSLVCPVIVTTADIHVLENTDIKEIETSKKIEDFSSLKDISLLSTPRPPIYIQKYIVEDVAKNTEIFVKSAVMNNKVNQSLEVLKIQMQTYLTKYSTMFPSRHYLVNYNNLSRFIEQYIAYSKILLQYTCNKQT